MACIWVTGRCVTHPNSNRPPETDYRGAHVLDWWGRLATITSVYTCETGCVVARLRRFNGEDAGEQTLVTLYILERD